ncbi:LacI family transcriptional regulator [Spirochaetia bacterium]|nr:LacI family transcriptional regulator [Spirochaetia bacterium]
MKKLFGVLLVVLLAVTVMGCSKPAEKKSADVGTYTVGFIVGSYEHMFYNLVGEGIEAKCAELGIKAIMLDGELDANVQSNHIENLVAEKVNAIALATVDAAGVKPAIEAADKSGIPVFTFDSPCFGTNVIKCHAGTDNVEGGRLGAREVLRLVAPGSTVAMIGNPASSSVLDRQQGFEEVIKAQDSVKYAFFGNYQGDATVAASLMQDWVTADPNLAAVFCGGDPAATGALSSIKSAGAKTLVVGYDGNPEAIAAIKAQSGDGRWWVSEISQNPNLIGSTIVEQIKKYLDTGSVDSPLIPIAPYIITYQYIQDNNL